MGKDQLLDFDDDLDERIKNTAKLIADFAKENLDGDLAKEIISDMSAIADGEEQQDN